MHPHTLSECIEKLVCAPKEHGNFIWVCVTVCPPASGPFRPPPVWSCNPRLLCNKQGSSCRPVTHLTFAATEDIASFLRFFLLDAAVPMLLRRRREDGSFQSETRHPPKNTNDEENATEENSLKKWLKEIREGLFGIREDLVVVMPFEL